MLLQKRDDENQGFHKVINNKRPEYWNALTGAKLLKLCTQLLNRYLINQY